MDRTFRHGGTAAGRSRAVLTPLLWRGLLGLTLFLSYTAPALSQANVVIDEGAIDFPELVVGTTYCKPRGVLVGNAGTAPLTASFSVFGTNAADFDVDVACATINANNVCRFSVCFTPTAAGNRSATLRITTNDPDQPFLDVALFGRATGTNVVLPPLPPGGPTTNPVPGTTLSASSLNFPAQVLNTNSQVQTATLCNTGGSLLSVTNVALGGTNAGDFAIAFDTGGPGLATNACRSVGIRFRPTALGARTGTLTFSTDRGSVIVALNGTGVAAAPTQPGAVTPPPGPPVGGPPATVGAARVTPGSVDFGNVTVASDRFTNVTLTSIGPGILSVGASPTSITGTNAGDFAVVADTGGLGLSTGGLRTFTIRFRPGAVGSRSATLNISTSAGNVAVPLSGFGTTAGAAASLNPTSIAFGNQTAGTTSAAQTITVMNTGSVPLSISSVSLPAGSAFTTPAFSPVTVGVGLSQTISVNFAPGAALTGAQSSTLTIVTNAGQFTVPVSGTAVAPAPALTLNPNPLIFSANGSLPVTLTNTGSAQLTISSITPGAGAQQGDFSSSFAPTCGSGIINAGLSCQITITFTAGGAGPRSGSFNIVTNAGTFVLQVTRP